MVRVAVIGAGFWGRNHVRVLSDIEECEVVAVCDVNVERAKIIAQKYNIPFFFPSFDETIKKVELDAVSICTPSTTHAELSIKAIKAGLGVLIEKPMASNAYEAAKVLSIAEDNKTPVMVGFIERFNPVVSVAKNLVEKGEIGEVILSYSKRIGWWPERIGDVGVVGDTAIHDIDLTTYLFGEMPEKVYAIGGSLRHAYEDHVQALLTFKNSRSSIIEANWLTPRKKREMNITGEKGVISLKFIEQELVIEKSDESKVPMIKYQEPLRLELEYFIKCIKNRENPIPNAKDGFRASLISDAILESMKKHKQINIDEYMDVIMTSV